VVAELVLVAHARDLRQAAARVPVEAGLYELDAALVLADRVIDAEPDVELVADAVALNALPVGVIREAVEVKIEIKSAFLGGHRTRRRAEGQRGSEKGQHPGGAISHSRPRV
jgi:hypothetical protein